MPSGRVILILNYERKRASNGLQFRVAMRAVTPE